MDYIAVFFGVLIIAIVGVILCDNQEPNKKSSNEEHGYTYHEDDDFYVYKAEQLIR